MTPEQMQARSREKVKQVMDLMKLLQITVEPRERVTREGWIERTLFWSDNEKYPQAPVEERGPEGAEPAQESAEAPEEGTEEASETVAEKKDESPETV